MRSSCVAYGCKINRANKSQSITLHKFPKNEKLRKQWVKATRLIGFTPGPNSYLCSQHFKESDIDRCSPYVVRIRENAVPSLFGSKLFDSLKEKPKSRKPPLFRPPPPIPYVPPKNPPVSYLQTSATVEKFHSYVQVLPKQSASQINTQGTNTIDTTDSTLNKSTESSFRNDRNVVNVSLKSDLSLNTVRPVHLITKKSPSDSTKTISSKSPAKTTPNGGNNKQQPETPAEILLKYKLEKAEEKLIEYRMKMKTLDKIKNNVLKQNARLKMAVDVLKNNKSILSRNGIRVAKDCTCLSSNGVTYHDHVFMYPYQSKEKRGTSNSISASSGHSVRTGGELARSAPPHSGDATTDTNCVYETRSDDMTAPFSENYRNATNEYDTFCSDAESIRDDDTINSGDGAASYNAGLQAEKSTQSY